MSSVDADQYDIHDLAIAYRKAKADLYYSSNANLTMIAEYEVDLITNLEKLLDKIISGDMGWVEGKDKDDSFLGSWKLVPAKIDHDKNSKLIYSSRKEEWEQRCKQERPKAQFRLMADKLSLDLYVLSTLWVLHVGEKFDKKLSDSAYGSRLRRKKNEEQSINNLSLGTFKHYFTPYRKWRDNGIQAMREGIKAKKDLAVLTADITSFYHCLDPHFLELKDNPFFELFSDVEQDLTERERHLHKLFVSALIAWAESTPLKTGLPVGLPASALVANLALIELDQIIEKQVVPLYYGRYVDDIILVLHNGSEFKSTGEVWDWLFARSNGVLDWVESNKDSGKEKAVQFKGTCLKNSKIEFSNEKNKLFLISAEGGSALVDSIEQNINQRSSEWRLLPDLPVEPEQITTEIVTAMQDNGEAADSLRKTDSISTRRALFAIRLRDYEAYQRDLEPDDWKQYRHALYQMVIDHLLVLPHYFELQQYLLRVIRMAVACGDFEYLCRMLVCLMELMEQVEHKCNVVIKSADNDVELIIDKIQSHWISPFCKALTEHITAALPTKNSEQFVSKWCEFKESIRKTKIRRLIIWTKRESIENLIEKQAKLFSSDLAQTPFRHIGLLEELVSQQGIPRKETVQYIEESKQLFDEDDDVIVNGAKILSGWFELGAGRCPNGLLFPTRPVSLHELYQLSGNCLDKEIQEQLKQVMLAQRGFNLSDKMPQWNNEGDLLKVPDGKSKSEYKFALSSWETGEESWVAAVTKQPYNRLKHYQRMTRLINTVIEQKERPDYLILPELSIPSRWFMGFALKLNRKGVSLIGGVEYLHHAKKYVRNQVWVALTHQGQGFPSLMIYRQDKQIPAPAEAKELKRIADKELLPEIFEPDHPPVIEHRGLRFALLICSELTNINYRSRLRGEIDALIIPEWNRDTGSFNALVESAALDIHAFIIQCNDRKYGDSRIRAPYKERWLRDLLRVKGGIHDYCVTEEIDVQSLRQFQSSNHSPGTPFKPTPDGFQINLERKVLPVKESE